MTLAPGAAMAVITLWAGYVNITVNYLPKGLYLLAALSVLIMTLILVIMAASALRWIELMHMEGFVTDGMGDKVLQRVADENPH